MKSWCAPSGLAGAAVGVFAVTLAVSRLVAQAPASSIGREVAIAAHLDDGQELATPLVDLIAHGRRLFEANWTDAGRRRPSADEGHRPSAGRSVAAADRAARVQSRLGARRQLVRRLPQRAVRHLRRRRRLRRPTSSCSASASTSRPSIAPTRCRPAAPSTKPARPVTLQTAADFRATTGMFGAGYLEMLARQMTEELQQIRDSIRLGETQRAGRERAFASAR